jgi:hypothetical protein
MSQAKKGSRTQRPTAPERLFKAAFGRKMKATERRRFIWEKPQSLKELAKSERRDLYAFLRQT